MSSGFFDDISRLPAGTTVLFEGMQWKKYAQLHNQLGASYSVRIFYDRGKMEILIPNSEGGRQIEILRTLISAISDELDIDIESLGSTTLRQQEREAAAEPDASFYVQHAAAMHGKLDLNLVHDPPPDLVVENNHATSQLDKFGIYARLGVPEIWRVFSQQVNFWRLRRNTYHEVKYSHCFPFLIVQILNEYLEQGLLSGERRAAKAFRDWIKTQTEQA